MLLSFNKCSISASTAPYLSENRVNAIGDNSNISYQLQTEFHSASPIPYHVFLNCEKGELKSNSHAQKIHTCKYTPVCIYTPVCKST